MEHDPAFRSLRVDTYRKRTAWSAPRVDGGPVWTTSNYKHWPADARHRTNLSDSGRNTYCLLFCGYYYLTWNWSGWISNTDDSDRQLVPASPHESHRLSPTGKQPRWAECSNAGIWVGAIRLAYNSCRYRLRSNFSWNTSGSTHTPPT